MHTLNFLLLAAGTLTFLSLRAGIFSARLGLSYFKVSQIRGERIARVDVAMPEPAPLP